MARTIKIDNAELKRRAYKKAKREVRNIICRILIVCEGKKTEPNYFRAFNKKRQGNFVYELKLEGGGVNTMAVVDQAMKLQQAASIPYDRVWTVFDKDSFPEEKFNGAIVKAGEHGVGCAWSNEAFELWYLLHFVPRVTPMVRDQYAEAISAAVNASPGYKSKKPYKYAKNDSQNYMIMTTYGSQDDAISRAQQQEQRFEGQKFATHNPCTTVFKLVRQLIGQDVILNNELKEKVDG